MARKTSRAITVGGPLGLVLGLAAGWLAHSGQAPWLESSLVAVEPVGILWMNALRVAVVPLTVCLVVVGVCAIPQGRALGRWVSLTMGWMVAMLVGAGLLTVLVSKLAFEASPPAPLTVSLQSATNQKPPDAASWVEEVVPRNLFEAASQGKVLPLAVMAAMFGLALRAVAPERRKPVEAFFVGLRDALLVFVHWIVLGIPVGAFALSFAFTTESGLSVAGTLLHFVAFTCALLIGATLAVVAATLLAARRLGAAVGREFLPLVSVAAGTRSSLASLPSLVDSAARARLPQPATDIVLPTCVSLFKLNRTITSTAKMLFLAAAIGLVVSPQALVVFLGTVLLLSFATPGIPAGGSSVTWGAYMAAGIPLEAIVLFEVTDPLTDVFKTVLNVLADFSVAVLVSGAVVRMPESASIVGATASESTVG